MRLIRFNGKTTAVSHTTLHPAARHDRADSHPVPDAGLDPYGFAQIDQLCSALVDPANRGKLIVVAWEHKLIVKLLRQIMSAHGGNAADVPKWQSGDFDSIYIVRLDWQNGIAKASFKHDNQGLNGRAADCPCAALPHSPSASAASAPKSASAAD